MKCKIAEYAKINKVIIRTVWDWIYKKYVSIRRIKHYEKSNRRISVSDRGV